MSNTYLHASIDKVEEHCLQLANRLIEKYNIPTPAVLNIGDINSDLIVLLFQSITAYNISDLLSCVSKVDEAHNVQAVIDTLSLDLLGLSLSHITGDDVVAGNLVSIYNLLEVLEGLALYISPSTSSQHYKDFPMKRKVCRRKKSKTSISKLNGSPLNGREIHVQDENKEVSTNGSFSHARLLKRLKQKRSRPKTSIEKSTSSENLVHSSTRSPPSKLPKKDEINESIKDESNDEGGHTSRTNTQIEHQIHDLAQVKINRCDHTCFHTEKVCMPTRSTNKKKFTKIPHVKKETVQHFEEDQEVEELYEKNLEKKVRALLEKDNSFKSRAALLRKTHLRSVRKFHPKPPLLACNKSYLLPHTLRRRSVGQVPFKRPAIIKSHSTKKVAISDDRPNIGFIEELFEEFPSLQLTPSIVNHIRKRYKQHLITIHRQVKDCFLKKPKTHFQAEDVARKQTALSNILKKDIKQQLYLKTYREHKKFENTIKYHLRDARLQTAKMKKYCDEFHYEMRKKMQKRNFTEEFVFEKLFKDALKIQKEQVERLCDEVKETGENDARKHLVYLDALENLYQTQFSMLSETLMEEKSAAQEKAKTQELEMNTMKRKFQEELKREIRFMQQVIVECTEDTHFRELDAEQFRAKLRNR